MPELIVLLSVLISGHSDLSAWSTLTEHPTHSSPTCHYILDPWTNRTNFKQGPGGHISKGNTSFFNPNQYRVVLLDQRGCGRSRPNASTVNNTTWHLVSDIEKLREHLAIEKWHVVFGGSWGSTLALAYAQAHPSSVGSLVLRGIFAFRALELKWSNTYGGANFIFPDHYDEFIDFLPEEERKDHVASYHKRLMSEDESISHPAATAWNKFEISISTLYPNVKGLSQLDDASYNLAHARMEIHYFTNGGWLEDGQLLKKENIDKIRHIPSEIQAVSRRCFANQIAATIVQGRYDIVCPPITAWELHKAFPESKLHWSADAGHSATVCRQYCERTSGFYADALQEPGTKNKLMEACEEYANLSL